MTRREANMLVSQGVLRIVDGEYVYVRPPMQLEHHGLPVPLDDVQHTRLRFVDPNRRGGSW